MCLDLTMRQVGLLEDEETLTRVTYGNVWMIDGRIFLDSDSFLLISCNLFHKFLNFCSFLKKLAWSLNISFENYSENLYSEYQKTATKKMFWEGKRRGKRIKERSL